MLIALNKRQRNKQNTKILERTSIVVNSIVNEINNLEKELGYPLVENYKKDMVSDENIYSNELIELLKMCNKKLINFSDSVYIPFSISEAIKHPDIDPIESIVHIYAECEEWLKVNNPEVLETRN